MNYDPALARTLLTRTPALLRVWLGDLPSEWLDAPEHPGAWSPRDVVCHLTDLEADAWLPRVRTILEHGTGRTLAAVDPERFRTRFAGASLTVVLDEFAATRARNLQELDDLGLDEALLGSTGLHSDFGEVSLSQLLATWAVHDLTHLSQVSRALAAQYRHAVGPWIGFLSVLRARRSEDGQPPDADAR